MKIIKAYLIAWDYTFYRVSKAYWKFDKNDYTRTLMGISLSQCYYILVITMICLETLFKIDLKTIKSEMMSIFIPMLFVLLAINYIRFKGRIDTLNEKWRNEPFVRRKWNGFFVVLALIGPILITVIYIIIRD